MGRRGSLKKRTGIECARSGLDCIGIEIVALPQPVLSPSSAAESSNTSSYGFPGAMGSDFDRDPDFDLDEPERPESSRVRPGLARRKPFLTGKTGKREGDYRRPGRNSAICGKRMRMTTQAIIARKKGRIPLNTVSRSTSGATPLIT